MQTRLFVVSCYSGLSFVYLQSAINDLMEL